MCVSRGATAYFTALHLLFVCERVPEASLQESFVMPSVLDCMCASVCLHRGRSPDGSPDTEDELASALVSMAAAGFIRLSL